MKRAISGLIVFLIVAVVVVGSFSLYARVRNGQSSLTFFPDSPQAMATRAQALEIVRALEQYRAKHNQYPDSLESLIPDEIRSIDPPRYGHPEWIYLGWKDVENCTLGFGARGSYPACHYRLKTADWYIDE